MPYALASRPQMFVPVTQHERACENAIIGHFGASGGGGVHTPITMFPHVLIAASAQHATGAVLEKPGLGGAAVQVIVPHVTVAAAVPAVPAEVPAAAEPVPATPDIPPLPAAALVPAVTAPVPLAAAAVPAIA
jgi:hypothetical protein